MSNSQNTIKAKYQWTEAFLFLGMFAMVALSFFGYSYFSENKVMAIASQAPSCPWNESAPAAAPKATGQNLFTNSSFENVSTSGQPEGWSVSSWGNNQFQSSLQPEQGRNGSAGLRIEMHNLHSGGAMWQSTKALPVEPMTSYLFQSYYRSDVNTSIVAEITLKDGSKVFQNLGKSSPSQAWKLQSYTFVAPRSAIKATVYQVLNTEGYVVTDDYYLGRYQPKPLPIGMVSLTFDDGAEQIYTNALPLLDKYNIKSTQYVVTQPIPNKHSGYYINSEQLLAFTASGHELGSHTSTHLNLAEVDPNQSESEMIHAQKELYELTGNTVLNFATPYGSYDQRVIEQSRQYYCSHRSTDLGFNSPDYFDLYNIKVKNITVDTPVEEIYAWIDYAEKNRVWLVIVLHEIGYDNGHYSYTPENLEKLLTYLSRSNVATTTMTEGIQLMQSAQAKMNSDQEQGDTLSIYTTIPSAVRNSK